MPTAVKSGYVFNGGGPINYLQWGDANAPPLVLIHGVRGFAYSWRLVAERLLGHYRCIAINLHGHGDSSAFPQREYDNDLYVSDVHALADQLDLRRFTIIGFSLGGSVALRYAMANPDRVQALVVIDAGLGLGEERARAMKRMVEAMPAEFAAWQDAIEYIRRQRPSLPPAFVQECAPYALRRLPSGKIAWKHDALLREEWLGPDLPARARVQSWDGLERISCPMLILKGATANQLSVEQCERLAGYGRNSRWVEVPNTTHFVHEDNLQGFLNEVEPFLKTVTTKAGVRSVQ